jgi:predicted RNase H-like HicB family nuclease
MSRYIAVIDGHEGEYGVVFPDVPGCTSGGATIDEAIRNASDSLTMWAEEAMADHVELPRPRRSEEVSQDPEIAQDLASGAVLAAIPLMISEGRSVKATISLDAGLLRAIDEAAEERGLTRSSFLADSARQRIASGV